MSKSARHEPTNPNVRYEHTDVNSGAAIGFAVALGVGLAIIMGAVWGMFLLFENKETARKQSLYPSPDILQSSAPGQEKPPTMTPWIEGIPAGKPEYTFGRFGPASAIVKLRADDAVLTSYEWLNAERTVARIPIFEAMKRLAADSADTGGRKP